MKKRSFLYLAFILNILLFKVSLNPMPTLEQLQTEIDEIKARNKRVELDKAWEKSWTRKLIVLILTYMVIVIFFLGAKLPEPFINAIVPAIAFVLSTLTVPLFKTWWLNKVYKKY